MRDSKEHILKTAFRLFLQKNFKEVTMNEIVTATELSKGAFYHYFKSKEQLFTEVINTFYFNKMVIDYGKLCNDSLWEFYHEYIEQIKIFVKESKAYLNYKDPRANVNYLTMMFDALKLFPGFRDRVREEQKKELDAWTAIIKKSREKGEFSSPMSDKQIAGIFIYTDEGIGLHLLLNGELGSADNEMLTLWNNFYKELKK